MLIGITELIAGESNITPKKTRNKYGIPKGIPNKEYQRLMRICKKEGIVYADIAVLESLPHADDPTYMTVVNSSTGPHWKTVIKNSVNQPHEPITGE